jgi:hypothetical protein
MIKTIYVTTDEWEKFLELSRRYQTPRRDWRKWCAVFSINPSGNKWSFATYGRTPFPRRNNLRGIKIVDNLREEYLEVKAPGGRVFVNRKGAFYKMNDREAELVPFVAFRFPRISIPTGPLPLPIGPLILL